MSPKAPARRPRTRRRARGSIQSYQTAAGNRWRYQIWGPIDPEQPDLGEKKFSRGSFATASEADAALQDALKQRDQQEHFGRKVPTFGVYADAWVEGLKFADSTIAGYKRIIRDHLRPQLGHYPLDKLTPTRIAATTATSNSTDGRMSGTRATRTMNIYSHVTPTMQK